MSILEAVILGIIQGLTEFIPVSSSGHLVLAHHLFGAPENGLAFDIALHAGTLLALLIFFGKDLFSYALSLFVKSDKTRITRLLIAATIPAAMVGFLLESAAESTFRSPVLVSINLIVVGGIMLLAENFYSKQKEHTKLEKISTKQGMAMGFAQALAIVPGVSRSGSTIIAGLFTGIDRVAATRFSFLLGIPIITGAMLKVFTDSAVRTDISQQAGIFAIGIITAFISGFIAIRFMLKFLSGHGLHVFAYYRIALGLLVIVLLGVS